MDAITALIIALRKILSRGSKVIIELTLQLGLIPILDKLITCEFPSIRVNAIWCLINLAGESNETVKAMMELETHKKILMLINVSTEECLENVSLLLK